MKHLVLFFASLFCLKTATSQTLTVNNFLHCSIIGVELLAEVAPACGPGSYSAFLYYIEVGETVSLDFTAPNSPTGSGLIRWTGGGGAWTPSFTGTSIRIVGARVFNPCGTTPGTCSATGNPYDEVVVGDAACSFSTTGSFTFETPGCALPPGLPNTVNCPSCTGGGTSNANVTFTASGGNWDITVLP